MKEQKGYIGKEQERSSGLPWQEPSEGTPQEIHVVSSEKIKVMIPEEALDARIRELGELISRDYEGRTLHLICILRGSVLFMSELSKRITVPVTMDFMSVSSYGDGTVSSGNILIKKDLEDGIEGKDVLVVEDIIDTGRTLSYLFPLLQERKPASLALCTMLDKPDRRTHDISVDYTAFEIPDVFVVGYGLDHAQKFRNLPYIGEKIS